MATSVTTVQGSLYGESGMFPVRLQLVVKSLPGTDDRMVSECRLIDGDIPNGSFTLEYFYFRQYRERVRVQFGMFLAA
jgi:hypothetical protein